MNRIAQYIASLFLIANVTQLWAQKHIEKVSHAEPLYMDLVRDLGAHKGEKEFNWGADFTKKKQYNKSAFLVEYEFAPINRLGLEVEADFSFYDAKKKQKSVPNNIMEGLRLSSQYSFFVSTQQKISMAVGYTQILEFTEFKFYGKESLLTGTVFNPFFIVAKKWNNNFNTLIYTSALVAPNFSTNKINLNWQINTSLLYTLPRTHHFVGVELNKELTQGAFEMTVRPQLKFKCNEKLAIGLVCGIAIQKAEEKYSAFMRIIYEL
jgi:hypothetical protein